MRARIYCENMETLLATGNEIQSFKPSYDDIIFFHDVGVFLIKKLKLVTSKNIEGAIELNDLYSNYKIQRLIKSLNNAVTTEKLNDINTLRARKKKRV